MRFLSQVAHDQLGEFADEAEWNNWINGTLIPQADNFIDTFCQHQFGSLRGTLRLDGNGKDVLWFPPGTCPILRFTAGSLDTTAITVSDLKIHKQYVEWDGGVFTEGEQNVVFDVSYGYDATPDDIAFVSAQLCSNILTDMIRRRVAPEIFMSFIGRDRAESSAGLRTLFASPDVLSPPLEHVLEKYRILWVDLG